MWALQADKWHPMVRETIGLIGPVTCRDCARGDRMGRRGSEAAMLPKTDESIVAPSKHGKAASGAAARCVLELLGGFQLVVDGQHVHLPRAAQKLLAYLALFGRMQPRSVLAGQLWPDATEGRAMARLRTAVWRARQVGPFLVDTSTYAVRLGDVVSVDALELTTLVHRYIDESLEADDTRLAELAGAGELLPEWDDEWLAPQRECFRQTRLHALERLGERLAMEGRFGRAVEISMMVVAADPLRESAQRVLIRTFAAEGNAHEAFVQYLAYRDAMRDELGLEPSEQMEALIDELGIKSAQLRRT
jgi:DNA-binding SARP family transcriptional activator